MRIGLISDTHGYLDPKIKTVFAGVGRILHAGDVGLPGLILELEEIAPVTAALGNNDFGLDLRETEVILLDGRKFLVHHIVDVRAPQESIHLRIIRENPDVVVFGHTHKRYCEAAGGTLYINPGYAGKPRFNQPRSVAVLRCDEEGMTVEFTAL
ncbi:MAG: metallophosphoesterase family protein [Verrucomicrobiota bacterium]